MPPSTAKLAKAAPALLRHPELWLTAVRQVFLLAPKNWYRQWPPLPLPDDGYLDFRMETAYGSGDQAATGADLISYLKWCKRQPYLRR